MRKRLVVTAGLVLALIAVLAACGEEGAPGPSVVIGSDDRPEMRVMAEIYAGALRNSGTLVSPDQLRGDDGLLLDEMDRAALDLFPAFTGDLLTRLAPTSTARDAEDVYTDLNRALPQGVSVGDETPVSAAPQIFVSTTLAGAAGASDLTDCGLLPEGLPVVALGEPDSAELDGFAAAGCRFGAVETAPSVEEVLQRAASGTAVGLLTPLDVAGDDAQSASADVQALRTAPGGGDTADNPPASAESGDRTDTPEPGAPGSGAPGSGAVGPRAEVLVPVFRTAALNRDQVKTMNKVAGEITTADLATMAGQVRNGAEPRDVALAWLGEHGL